MITKNIFKSYERTKDVFLMIDGNEIKGVGFDRLDSLLHYKRNNYKYKLVHKKVTEFYFTKLINDKNLIKLWRN